MIVRYFKILQKTLNMFKNNFFFIFKNSISKPIIGMLKNFYTVLLNYPRLLSIPLFIIIVGLFVYFSIVLWCVLFSTFLGAPFLILKASSIYDFTTYTIASWMELYRVAWLASAAEYAANNNVVGKIPIYILYFNTLKYSTLFYPNIAIFNLLLVLYMVLFGHCCGVILHGLIMQKPTIEFKINVWHVVFRMIVQIIVLIVFVLCPPVFGPGVPANFETGDPQNPIDWTCAGCNNPFVNGWDHLHSSLGFLLLLFFIVFLLSYGLYQAVHLLKTIKTVFSTKQNQILGTTLKTRLIDKKTTFALIAVLLIIVVYYLYWINPTIIHEALDYVQMWSWETVSYICRALFRVLNSFIKALIPQTASCNDGSNSSRSSNDKSFSWFGWGRSNDSMSSTTKKDDFVQTMVTKAKSTYNQCDQKLKQTLDEVEQEPLTPRRDKLRKEHAWEMHKACKEKVESYFDALSQFGSAYISQQTQQASSVYSGSYDFKNKKFEIKRENNQ